MADEPSVPLKVVDGLDLDEKYRKALRPGDLLQDRDGNARRLPRFFYEIDSWDRARKIELSPHFALWEFINTDLHEVETLRRFPRYIPCAVAALAAALEVLRAHLGTVVHIAANGGYRSPAHKLSGHASTHHWATAANIYRIGDEYIDGEEKIQKYAEIARKLLPAVWPRPFGHNVGFADDHLHLDLGYAVLVPRDAGSEA
ncbi:MAG TPA: hypothetical protein VGK99_20190 [Acidobacteriota bacterium]|jgi:hypothetical protein